MVLSIEMIIRGYTWYGLYGRRTSCLIEINQYIIFLQTIVGR